MIEFLRRLSRRIWPVVRLRWIFLGTLFLVAALPGFAALGLRVYENALVRRTEAEIAAQAAAIAATAELLWPKGGGSVSAAAANLKPAAPYSLPVSAVDLRSSPVLAARPAAREVDLTPDRAALAVAVRIAPVIAETKRTTLASILLLDRRGILLNGPEAGRSLAGLPEVRAALAGRSLTVLRHNDVYSPASPLRWISRGTTIRLHHARPIAVDGVPVGVVLVSRSPAALFRGMWEDAGKIAAGTALIGIVLVLLTAALVRAIVRPIEKLSDAARALSSGRAASVRRPTLEVSEIRSLYDDFEVMSASIAHRSRYLRDFAAALSHEFKTPLAGLRGGIELLQDHGASMSGDERARFLANIAADTDRLSRLVGRMLDLAQADMRGGEPAGSADLEAVLARLADGLRAPDFAIDYAVAPEVPPLAIEPAALESILATLIENARQAGAGRIAISASATGSECTIDLADDGPGVPAGDRERIFDPFFTSRRDSGGTGLGLPIARALVGNRGGSLELVEGGDGGHFVIVLPVSGGLPQTM